MVIKSAAMAGRSTRRQRGVGVQDVAREAGVSNATVSRVVNMPDQVGPEVRRRVEAAITKLNYIPSGAGRALITRRTRMIGVLVPQLAYVVHSAIIEALQRRVGPAGYNVVLGLVGYGRENEYAEVRRLLIAGAEAMTLIGEQRDPAIYQALDARGIPYVLNSVYHPDSPHPTVGYDNRGVIKELTGRLLELGHRRIAVLAGDWPRTDRLAERLEGFRAALTERRVAPREDWMVAGEPTAAAGRAGLRQLMAGEMRPTAVMCFSDAQAFGALIEAQAMGLRVPQDLSITGFSDHELAAQFSPSLTTVRIPFQEMSTRIGDYLLDRLRGEPVPHATKVEAPILWRESTGPASSR
jgi:LacI family transcriptional regulator, galactose operon repressor